MADRYVSEGLDISNLDETSQAEIDANLAGTLRRRAPLYNVQTVSLMLDYAPDVAKLHRWMADQYGRPHAHQIATLSTQNVHSYIMLGWETGIMNEFHTLRRCGMNKEQFMELVMFTQLTAGMRGLGHVYRAIGDVLPITAPPEAELEWPEGWAVDADAFKCGLTLNDRSMSKSDRDAITGWYEETIGFVPKSIQFGLKYHPEFVKVHRAKWERCIKTLPKQVAPYMMLRHHMITGSKEGLREAAIWGKAWGISPEWIVKGITNSAFYFAGFEGLYTAAEAVDDLLEAWSAP